MDAKPMYAACQIVKPFQYEFALQDVTSSIRKMSNCKIHICN